MEELISKIPPHNIEAEQSALAAMLLDRDAIVTASEILHPEDFYRKGNELVFEAVMELYNTNEPVDLITLSEILKKKDMLEAIGGETYLIGITDALATTANIRTYCEIIEEKAVLRRLIQTSNQIMAESYRDQRKVTEILAQAETSIFQIAQSKNTGTITSMREILSTTLDQIEELSKNAGKLTGITTGFNSLDAKLNGLQRSDLILVAARPAMGKSALAMNFAENAAVHADATVVVFSLEMAKEQLAQRMLSSMSNIELNRIRNGDLDNEAWAMLIAAMQKLAEKNIFIDDTPGVSLNDIRAKCRRMKAERGLDMIVIDYLQLMDSDGNSENRQQEVSKISRGLKLMARELDCPVVTLSQLSRAPEQRADHRPIMSDLRESGAIEQDADVVLMLYRDDYYDEQSEDQGLAEVIITKQRNGPTGTVKLAFRGEYTKFMSLES